MNLERRKRILAAAEALFSARRFHEITVEEVARNAGVGKGTVYRYFKDKDDLFSEVILAGYDELCGVIAAEAEDDVDFRDLLLRVSIRITEFHHRRLQWVQVGQGDGRRLFGKRGKRREQWRERFSRLLKTVSAIMVRGRDQGVLRKDIEVETLALFFLTLLRARGLAARKFNGVHVEREVLVDFFCNGACRQSAAILEDGP